MKNRIRIVALVAGALAAGAWGTPADALTWRQVKFQQCLEREGRGDSYGREKCCNEVGGAWVDIYDSEGNWIDGFCDGGEETTQTQRPGTTTGTYEEADQGSWTNNPEPASTNGTYEQHDDVSSGDGGTTTTSDGPAAEEPAYDRTYEGPGDADDVEPAPRSKPGYYE